MPKPTLKQLIETFTEEELTLTVPIDFQDVNADDYPIVNQYNTYLSSGNYDAALQYRNANSSILDKYIFDAKKMNMLQAMAINAYLFAKDNNGPTTPQGVNIVACTATGIENASTKLISGTITEVALASKENNYIPVSTTSDDETFLAAEDNGIRIYEYGYYLVCASAYITTNSTNGRIGRSIFVKLDNGKESKEILSTTETATDNGKGVMGAISTATKLIRITAEEMNPYKGASAKLNLYARCSGANGTVDNDNHSTFLTVIRIGS